MSPTPDTDAARRWMQVCEALDAVLDALPEQRDAVLQQHCAGDPSLRAEVESLLDAQAGDDMRLETPLVERAGDLVTQGAESLPPDRACGDTIGPWRLVRELGRGGMGSVWLAERGDGAFEQHVALKLLKRGLDSDAILERFLAERQILARLQHPNIAHLVDGGLTADGRPYFAMELVEGDPVTQWCDARRLPVAQRVVLFASIADAVQHAHRQLVVHRDLKPSNILVNAQGEAKLLDFGIAKLLDAEASRAEAATLTQMGIRMLTPEYAAPEQLRGDVITTSTDVYALGVLLYELLAGRRPPPASATETGKLPPRPSSVVEEDAAQHRSATPERLRRTLRGDLDTIVLRALHPDPERRYPTAEALAADLRRHLAREPVLARPDSLRYRTSRFIARNRVGVAAAALVLLSLAAGLVATVWQAREARQQARRAEQVKDFLVTVFEAGSPQEWRGKEPTARDLLDAGAKRADEELSGDPALHAEMLTVIGSLFVDQGQYASAKPLLQRSLDERRGLFGDDHTAYAESLVAWSGLMQQTGSWLEADRAAARAVEIYRRHAEDQPRTAAALGMLSKAKLSLGGLNEAIRLRREALQIHRRVYGEVDVKVAGDLRELGSLLVEKGEYDAAMPTIDKALAIDRELYGDQSARYATGIGMRARALYKQGRTAEAATFYRSAAGIYAKAGDPAKYEDALNHYGIALCRLGQYEEAIRTLRQSADLVARAQSAQSQWFGIRLISLGECLLEAGRPDEAFPSLSRGSKVVEASAGKEHAWVAYAHSAMARSLHARGLAKQALSEIVRAHTQFERQLGPNDASTADSLGVLGVVQFATGQRQTGFENAERAMRTLQRVQGYRHPMTAIAALGLAGLEMDYERAAQAAIRLQQVKQIFNDNGDKPRHITAAMLHGAALTRTGKARQAEPELRMVLMERRKLYGDDNPKVAEAEIHLGLCLMRLNRPEEARSLLRQGLAVLTQHDSQQLSLAVQAETALTSIR